MLENQGDILERLRNGTLTEVEIQELSQLLKLANSQGIEQSGKFNVAVGEGTDVHIGDVNHGVTLEQIRFIIQELSSFRLPHSEPSDGKGNENGSCSRDLPFRKLNLDSTTVKAINTRLDIIQEIYEAGYFPVPLQQELQQLKQHLQSFNELHENLHSILEQGDGLIREALESMRLQLNALKISSQNLTDTVQNKLSQTELNCRKEETQAFQTFIEGLEDSRAGAEWISTNTEVLTKYACKRLQDHFIRLDLSDKVIDDFRFSLKQFLEQVSFSLHWGTYEILDSPEIPFVLETELYEEAFRLMQKGVSKQLRPETLREIELCLDYLIERLPFIDV
jgi:hypothetical protein